MPTELSGTASCLREKLISSEIKITKERDLPDVFFGRSGEQMGVVFQMNLATLPVSFP